MKDRAISSGLVLLSLGIFVLALDAVYVFYQKYMNLVAFLSSAQNPLVVAVGIIGLAALIIGIYFQTRH